MRRNPRGRTNAERIGGAEARRWIFAFLLLAACGKTPADAIVPEAAGPGPDGGDGCDGVATVGAGLFRLRSPASGLCLDIGASTVVGVSPAHETTMADCASSQVWELKATTSSFVTGTVYEVASTTIAESLDIYMGMMEDETTAITFMPNKLANQKFQFRSRGASVFEMAPAHVIGLTSCLSSLTSPLAIRRCSAAAADQEWVVVPADCS